MTGIDDFDDEFVDKLREATEDFICSVGGKHDENIPTREIYVPENEHIVRTDISWPSPVLNSYLPEKSQYLRTAAEWIEEHPGQSYRWDEVFTPNASADQPNLSDLVVDPNQNQLINTFEDDLFELSQDIVNYSGDLEWTEEAFEQAAERFLVDLSFQGPLGDISKEFRVLFPLVDFELEPDSIDLEPDIPIVDRHDGEWISDIEISMLNDSEIAALYTHNNSRELGDNKFGDATYAIKISANGTPYASNDDQIRAAVATGLRLFKPQDAVVHADRGYRLESGPITHRAGLLRVVAGTDPMSTPNTPYFGNKYKLNTVEAEIFEDFWKQYKSELNTETDSNIGRALRRLNYVHQKSNLEDRLVDCAIALEGTLLRDINPGSSLSFRLRLRSGLLLDREHNYSRKTVREIFRAIYIARGDIVHSDQQLDEIIDGNNRFDIFEWGKPDPRQFVSISQTLLAKVLLRYVIEKIENGRSITEVNQDMDLAALEAAHPYK